ncbi:MAG: hypothetical protein C4527_22050 [Candidatus Omnitrophota bacterium]|jgi:hypothetical protein|nr:MAG: hypothetical protein C4527_22050 [Candidatus Omnitrophota bacterium]
MPAIIKDVTQVSTYHGTYYYMFYVRYLDPSPDYSYYNGVLGYSSEELYRNGESPKIGGFADRICVARALIEDVTSTNYQNNPNPWKQGFRSNNGQGNWTFTENGRGGYSYPVINDNRFSPQIHYNTDFEEYLMICCGYREGFYIYMTNNQNLLDWGTGVLILPEPEGQQILDPSLIGGLGDDKRGSDTLMLYYAHDPDQVNGQHHLVRRQILLYEE